MSRLARVPGRAPAPRCAHCRVARVVAAGAVCLPCQAMLDRAAKALAQQERYIAQHGQQAWDRELTRRIDELY